jgi:hypothetical protein
MSEDEVVEAYTKGQLSRRNFVRKLVTRGVPLAAAIAYANSLSPHGGPNWVPPGMRTATAGAQAGSPFMH